MTATRHVHIETRERSLIERVVLAILALALVALGFFFLAAAIVAGAILAGVILLRFWWLKRKLAKAAEEEFVRAEYTVVENEKLVEPREPRQRGQARSRRTPQPRRRLTSTIPAPTSNAAAPNSGVSGSSSTSTPPSTPKNGVRNVSTESRAA
jgi:hypothetical protein